MRADSWVAGASVLRPQSCRDVCDQAPVRSVEGRSSLAQDFLLRASITILRDVPARPA
jgi:hypothetical protein